MSYLKTLAQKDKEEREKFAKSVKDKQEKEKLDKENEEYRKRIEQLFK